MHLSLVERDREAIWHPYTQMRLAPNPLPVVSGSGVYLEDEAGTRYIDAISSWWVNLHGHGHPYLAAKVYEQALKLEQVIFAGFTHAPAVDLAERLLKVLPGEFSKVFYSDNGSTAVEVALKMAIQYWKNTDATARPVLPMANQEPAQDQERAPANGEDLSANEGVPANQRPGRGTEERVPANRVDQRPGRGDEEGVPANRKDVPADLNPALATAAYKFPDNDRKKILALSNSYHGDTFGAMSVSERGTFTLPFQDYLFEVVFINVNNEWSLADNEWDEFACFIYEPLVQGAGGMKMYEASKLNALLKKCRQHRIICIADEVMTGFGRTGKLFASEYVQEKPDIICLSKGITGGMMALGATVCTQEIYDAFLSDDRSKTFFHGHSYTGNPLACAAANASLDLLLQDDCISNIQRISQRHASFMEKLLSEKNSRVRNLRCLGTIMAFEVETDGTDGYLNNISSVLHQRALKEGVLIRPLGNTVYVMPPYCITDEELEKVYGCIMGII